MVVMKPYTACEECDDRRRTTVRHDVALKLGAVPDL